MQVADERVPAVRRPLLNNRSEFSPGSAGTLPWPRMFNPRSIEEDKMKKFVYVIAALGAIGIVAPSIASAEDVVIKHRDHDRYGARAEFREHRDFGLHEGWRHRHADRVVIVRHRHHQY
jgi:hypothetical protein